MSAELLRWWDWWLALHEAEVSCYRAWQALRYRIEVADHDERVAVARLQGRA